ncbi:hypothetical protein Pla110_13370 [Polystyrenella longa]|uniref:Uncharacterized protein n=1 Tax=Polystyrenella longa TaxID=2528007 RepID=A0A518CK72_9PLAN|nr:hypothetical protein [Polystyrenella longa]QDU79626.1 hypothetical protein Pla110_13370 [Polystyrenella longa]
MTEKDDEAVLLTENAKISILQTGWLISERKGLSGRQKGFCESDVSLSSGMIPLLNRIDYQNAKKNRIKGEFISYN